MVIHSNYSPTVQSVMQCDVVQNPYDDQDDDQDSLFGSPPASPLRGRSPSPGLALPSAGLSTQNVGTIALPGSQHCSELPVTPLALSLSYAQHEPPQRPPAQSITVTSSESSTPLSSRPPSARPANKFKKRTGKPSKSTESTPRPPPPPIHFPDPTAPVPSNFLRNQTALLGTAGLVGGVKPASLAVRRRALGTAVSNPIVIDDEERAPRRPSQSPAPPLLQQLGVDVDRLPAPSTQEIVSVLIRQKEIFPLLQGLLKLISQPQQLDLEPSLTSFRRTHRSFQPSGSANPQLSSSHSHSHTGPPAKKRRLDRVPAGASDWDVPYPFAAGEGPDSYRANWQRDRGKQLMSQLVGLIKDAVQKAAMKKHLEKITASQRLDAQRETAEPKVLGHYRPSTATYGLQGEAAAVALAEARTKIFSDASNNVESETPLSVPSQNPSASSSTRSTPTPEHSTSLNQLITSLLAVNPGQATKLSSIDNSENQVTPPVPSGNLDSFTPQFDNCLFNNWVDIFQTFPASAQTILSSNRDTPGSLSQPDSTVSTPISHDFDFFNFDGNLTELDLSTVDAALQDVGSLFNMDPTSTHGSSNDVQPLDPLQDLMAIQTRQSYVIDPELLASSAPHTNTISMDHQRSLTGSPMPSSSSVGDVGPSTPTSVLWDTFPEVFMGASGDGPVSGSGLPHLEGLADKGMWGTALQNIFQQSYDFPQASEESGGLTRTPGVNVGREIQATPHAPLPVLSVGLGATFGDSRGEQSSTTNARPANRKADVMKRAMERKQQLEAELASTRIQLWETTIEQGVLSHMSRATQKT
ncbi:hypothetical protein H0H93_009192 [Arthromyces matolae]|nr:hypothetical protein H0H93_009192 [Arthromyces matolae]